VIAQAYCTGTVAIGGRRASVDSLGNVGRWALPDNAKPDRKSYSSHGLIRQAANICGIHSSPKVKIVVARVHDRRFFAGVGY
jgi:hypothetical protein